MIGVNDPEYACLTQKKTCQKHIRSIENGGQAIRADPVSLSAVLMLLLVAVCGCQMASVSSPPSRVEIR